MMISNDNKKSSSDDIASARPYVMSSKEEIECSIPNLMLIADTKVRAQMQTEVAAESGIGESYTYHFLFFNPSSYGVPPQELSIEAFGAAAKATLMARVKAEAGAPDTDEEEEEEEGEGPKKSRKQKAATKKRLATGALSAAQEKTKNRQRARDEEGGA